MDRRQFLGFPANSTTLSPDLSELLLSRRVFPGNASSTDLPGFCGQSVDLSRFLSVISNPLDLFEIRHGKPLRTNPWPNFNHFCRVEVLQRTRQIYLHTFANYLSFCFVSSSLTPSLPKHRKIGYFLKE